MTDIDTNSDVPPSTIQLHTLSWTAEKRAKYQHYVDKIENSGNTNNTSDNKPDIKQDNKNSNTKLSDNDDSKIKSNDAIYIDCNNGNSIFTYVNNTEVKVHKQLLDVRQCIGYKYGSSFIVDKNNNIQYISDSILQQTISSIQQTIADKTNQLNFVSSNNNSYLSSSHDNKQLLKQNDILLLQDGTAESTINIIKQLIQNSTTHNDKTEFSQEKYINNKLIKHMRLFTIYKPNIRYLAETYYAREPRKINYIRPDGLALLTNHVYNNHNQTTLCIDHYNGLVLTDIAVKHAGHGTIINVYDTHIPRYDTFSRLGLSDAYTNNIVHIPMQQLYKIRFDYKPDNNNTGDSMNVDNNNTNNTTDDTTTTLAQSTIERRQRQQKKREHFERAKQILQSKSIDSIVISSKYNYITLMKELLPYLCSGGVFALHHTHIEMPSQTYDFCKFQLSSKNSSINKDIRNTQYNTECINVELFDSFMREYQVLPNRTHPDVNRSGGMGYILTGTKIQK